MTLIERKEIVKDYSKLEFNKSEIEFVELKQPLSNWKLLKVIEKENYKLKVYKNLREIIFIEINAGHDYSTFYKIS